jgi:hypothetical protein
MNVLIVTHKERSVPLLKCILDYSGFDTCHIFGSASMHHEKLIPKSQVGRIRLHNHRMMNKGKAYVSMNWDEIPSLSKSLIEEMALCEVETLKIFERVHKMGGAYESRKKHYMNHLRYWDYFLDKEKIDVFIRNGIVGAAGYDNIIYHLCRRKRIPVYTSYPFHPNMIYWAQDLKDPMFEIRKRYNALLEKEEVPVLVSTLKKLWEEHWERKKRLTKPVHINHTSGRTRKAIKPAVAFYDKHTTPPKYDKPYIYHALHYQPEATTAPLAGPFVDQILITEILSKTGLPVYVKEHPHLSKNRSIAYYQRLLKLPNVRLIDRNEPSYKLIDNSLVIATATGTVGWEAIMRGKPALAFGDIFWQEAPGAFKVGSEQECQKAIQQIQEGWIPDKRKIAIFMKAVEHYVIPEGQIGKALIKLIEKR